jgi:aminopeptidase N
MAETSAFDVAGGNLPLFAHEAAHGWWGNRVTSTGAGSILCSESLAQYSAVVAIEEIEGVDAATEFLRFSRQGYSALQCARGYFEMWRAGNDKAMTKLGGGATDHNLSDAKGHWVFHMLRDRMGDAAFFGVLRAVAEDPALENLSLDELRARFVAAAPDKRLARFFAEWLERPGAPVLEEKWTAVSDASGPGVRLTITQSGAPYDLDLEVDVVGEEGATTHTVPLRDATGEWRLASKGAPREVRIDPRHRLLIWTPEYGDKPR